MRTNFLILILFLAAACSQTSDTTTVGALTLPAKPHAGERINMQYNMDSSKMVSKDNLQITLYYTVKDKIYAEPVALSDTGNPVKASFTLPNSAQAFALRFQAKYILVSSKNGYISPVYDHAGKPVAGAFAGMSLFYNAILSYNGISINNIGSSLLGRPADLDTALKLMQADFKAHPKIKHDWMDTYLNTLLTAKKESAYPKIQVALQKMLSSDNLQEGDYTTAYDLYFKMNMWNKADSIMAVGSKMFPDGLMAKRAAMSRFYSFHSSLDSLIAHYRNFKQRFPAINRQSSASKIKDRMLWRIAAQYSGQGNYQSYLVFMSQVTDPVRKAKGYNVLARKLTEADKALPFADSISKMSLDLIQQSMNHPGQEKPSYQTNRDWKEDLQQVYARFANDYALLLSKEGKIKDAIAYQKQAVEYLDGKNWIMNEQYMQYLIEAKDYKTAQEQLEKFISNGKTTNKLNNFLKSVYVHLNHSEEGYTDYHHKLEEKAEAKLKSDLTKEMVDEPASNFTLPDLKGKPVSLATLKGKVVVVDFWATWCSPCKASMPGMQKVVDHFKNDSNVVFLFIDTWEKTSPEQRHKQVSDFITKNSYIFHILLDQRKADDSTQYQVISDYNASAIPTKFVIGPKGHIRFKKVGFFGSTQAEVREVSMMVEMAGS